MTDQDGGLPGRLVELVTALREHGVRVGTSETVDAGAVMQVLGLDDREQLRAGLAAALVRREGQRPVFDSLFDLYFPRGVGVRTASGTRDLTEPRLIVEALRTALLAALVAGDETALAALASDAVDLLGGVDGGVGPGQSGVGWSARQTLEALAPQTLIARADADRAAADEGFTSRLTRDELRREVRAFGDLVGTEALRRSAEVRGRERLSRHGVRPTVEQVSFLSADRRQLLELRRTVAPLSRKLASLLVARRNLRSRGTIDVRRTIRRSLGTGGVPLRPAYARRRQGRPEIVLLCDVSGSVAGFASFTMLLVQSLRDQFSKVRVFAFVNTTDEVTDLVRGADPTELSRRILAEASVRTWHTSSDYGEALGDFVADHGEVVGPRTSVLILGDARTNYSDPNLTALARIADRARHTYWLNPERRTMWGTGDSAAHEYARLVEMFECRNVDQLSALVARLLPT